MKRSQNRNTRSRDKRGVVLIIVAGVLAVLMALGAGFYTMMHSQTLSAVRYSDTVRAEFMAQAGTQEAIARLRSMAQIKTEDPTDPWYMWDSLRGRAHTISFAMGDGIDNDGDGIVDNEAGEVKSSFTRTLAHTAGTDSDRFTLQIEDSSSKININAGDNLGVILDNLCRLIGSPLVAAEPNLLQPRRWADEGAPAADYATNPDDLATNRDLYHSYFNGAAPVLDAQGKPDAAAGRPSTKLNGTTADYGDGYAIAAYRSSKGRFKSLEDVKKAFTYVDRDGDGKAEHPLEKIEIEAKFQALKPYITLDSWVDINTVSVGKFEWVSSAPVTINGQSCQILIDRDKSWIADDSSDLYNERGSLRGSYISIMNGHGAGQFRRIYANGTDWIAIKYTEALVIEPGPISSYMIIAKEDATPDPYDPANGLAPTDLDFEPLGKLKDDPNIDYERHPLCIHRAPVNINTASDKVLAALFMGIEVQHGHPMAIGTISDANKLSKATLPTLYSTAKPCVDTNPAATDWKAADNVLKLESYLLTPKGLKRVPADSGKLINDRSLTTFLTKYNLNKPDFDLDYVNQYGSLDTTNTNLINEAQELAMRILVARQRVQPISIADPDPILKVDLGMDIERGPFRSWDDFYFRIVRPFDEARLNDDFTDGVMNKVSIAKMIMAQFNSNTDILKFNPGIEWIDRWGRNFTEMEPVMVFKGSGPDWTSEQWAQVKPAGSQQGSYFIRSLRYKSDEMIDKTDLNRSTTEFCFDSGGIFEVTSTGQVVKTGQVLAERKIQSLVKVYDVWRESTQRQFVNGTISNAVNAKSNSLNGTSSLSKIDAGKIVRDASSAGYGAPPPVKKALDTLPEPLVPLNYTIVNANNADVVDTAARDAWQNIKPISQPDVVANRVLPAKYDGQLVLATNTRTYQQGDPVYGDSFLASFNGDLDTDTSTGNGREQAKTPRNEKLRVVDCIGLLGLINDSEIDNDPETPVDPLTGKLINIYVVASDNNTAMQPLPLNDVDPVTGTANRTAFWLNESNRAGDLRAEGVFLSSPGSSCKESTLKYLYGNTIAPEYGKTGSSTTYSNYDPGNTNGCTISLWFKPNWHAQDNREHEFFDGGNLGNTSDARYNQLYKAGYFSFSKPTGVSGGTGSSDTWWKNNDLWFGTEDKNDNEMMLSLHGGTCGVPVLSLPPNALTETPAYRTQPFRWSFVGVRFKYAATYPRLAVNPTGFWQGTTPVKSPPYSAWMDPLLLNMARPFINTQRLPEGASLPSSNFRDYWAQSQAGSGFWDTTSVDLRGQPAAYYWEKSTNANRRQGCFTINNPNEIADKPSGKFSWIYRSTPLDGTYAVLDELKIAKKAWTTDQIAAEQTVSRYYTPANPGNAAECPTFTSQSMIQSLRGYGVTASISECNVVRVNWTVFTPRFMYEYKQLGSNKHTEVIGGVVTSGIAYPGPYDYCQYNYEIGYDAGCGWKKFNTYRPELGCLRPLPPANARSPYSAGVEVELLDGATPISGYAWNRVSKSFNTASTFNDPDLQNRFDNARVKAANLRYRVRFRYPINSSVDPAGGSTVDPTKHYLLDTPVFDDISITYYSKPRVLDYRDVTE